MVVHFVVLVYLLIGGFLVWVWPWAIVPHLAMVTWGVSSTALGWHCPLTMLEDWARRQSGGPGLTTGFIDHYITGVLYPQRYVALVQIFIGLVVAFSWAGAYVRWRRVHAPSSLV